MDVIQNPSQDAAGFRLTLVFQNEKMYIILVATSYWEGEEHPNLHYIHI